MVVELGNVLVCGLAVVLLVFIKFRIDTLSSNAAVVLGSVDVVVGVDTICVGRIVLIVYMSVVVPVVYTLKIVDVGAFDGSVVVVVAPCVAVLVGCVLHCVLVGSDCVLVVGWVVVSACVLVSDAVVVAACVYNCVVATRVVVPDCTPICALARDECVLVVG